MSILVYNGEGTEYVDVLIKSLKRSLSKLTLADQYKVRTITAEELCDDAWLDTCKLLVLPGGRDLPYVRDISGMSIKNIQSHLSSGGSFLGLCAGAYFASSFVSFEENTCMEVKGSRPLMLFMGTAKGSVYPGFKYSSTSGLVITPIQWRDKETFHLYFNGGCEFIPDGDDFIGYETIGVYKDFLPHKRAIISLNKGKIILSGVHPEMDVDFLERELYTVAQWKLLQKYQQHSRVVFYRMVNSLLK